MIPLPAALPSPARPHVELPAPPAARPARWARRGAASGLGGLVVLALAAALAGCGKPTAAPAAPPAPKEVGVVELRTERLALTTELPGRTGARTEAEIRPQVGGIVQKRLFEEGALVKQGQVLYELDPASLRAAYASAQASVRKAEATVGAARTTARRNAELVAIEAVSRQVNDDSQATLAQAEADLGVARAAAETARINLGYARIVAPISGRVGLSTVTPGALVTANQTTALTTVQQLDPIQVDVTQSSAELLRLKRELASGRLTRSGEDAARITLRLEDGTRYPQPGRLIFSGMTVQPETGTITLRAVVPNPDGLLMPGMYVRAVLEEGVDPQALLVPQQAVTRNPDGSATVIVVDAENKVEQRAIQVDRAVGNRWQIARGLAAGDRVLVEGSQRARPGDTVRAVLIGTPGAAGTELASAREAASAPAPAAAR